MSIEVNDLLEKISELEAENKRLRKHIDAIVKFADKIIKRECEEK